MRISCLLNYTCRCKGKPRVKLNDEAYEFRWVAPAVARKMPLNTPTKILLEVVMGKRKAESGKRKQTIKSKIKKRV